MSGSKIRVLIVDDSAFARKVIRELLAKDESIEVVGIARDGLEALEKISELDPDVVTLDLVMPDLDGLGVLRTLSGTSRSRFVVVSVSGAETDLVLQALEAGAVDVVTKPTALATDRLYEVSPDLIFKVKAAAAARVRGPHEAREIPVAPTPVGKRNQGRVSLIAVGTSTGGPQALTELFKGLPADFPVPLVLALHIPAGYTESLAARLTALGGVPVVEARTGMLVQAGRAIIAPGGMHLLVHVKDGQMTVEVTEKPVNSLYHPSVNLLFQSVAASVGASAIGLIMTGMGDDGFEGSRAIKQAGGTVFAESQSSCIVYGMPRVVIEEGVADGEAPLERLADLLVRSVEASSARRGDGV